MSFIYPNFCPPSSSLREIRPLSGWIGSDSSLPAPRSRLTFDAEGVSDPSSIYFSRRLHHPTLSSGVTIGRGYDMRDRSSSEIVRDLITAGIDTPTARLFARGAGLSGTRAATFIRSQSFPEISERAEVLLFNSTWDVIARDVERIVSKDDVVRRYGETDWTGLDPKIREMLVDLRYRGDYTPATRRFLQESVAANDRERFTSLIADRSLWASVPRDRFERRIAFLST